jgi:hypothetical protein
MEDNKNFQVDEIITCYIKDARTGEIVSSWQACPLVDFCNCKTAVCRTMLPDESCYWYRYFKDLIERKEK